MKCFKMYACVGKLKKKLQSGFEWALQTELNLGGAWHVMYYSCTNHR